MQYEQFSDNAKKAIEQFRTCSEKICFNQPKFFAYSMFLNNVSVKERQDLYDFAFTKNFWQEK